jgi:uncharacterized protein (TIGR02594 family)
LTPKYTWLKIAEGEKGVKEITGISSHTPRILEYHAMTTLKAKQDEVPWCSSFVNWVMDRAGYPITKSAAAKSWMKWGVEVPLQYGCIVILKRTGGHHVGFYTGETANTVYLLGGNQADSVNVRQYKKELVLSARMPKELNAIDQAIFDVVGVK